MPSCSRSTDRTPATTTWRDSATPSSTISIGRASAPAATPNGHSSTSAWRASSEREIPGACASTRSGPRWRDPGSRAIGATPTSCRCGDFSTSTPLRRSGSRPGDTAAIGRIPISSVLAMEDSKAVFLSYASEDAEAAQRICDALRTAGVEVWFDANELRGGDVWDASIRTQIRECALFVPIVSANTDRRGEGYFRLEWKLAVDRSHLMADDHAFLVPVAIDGTVDANRRVPDKFREVQWTRLLGGETPANFVEHVRRILSGSGPALRAAPSSAAAPAQRAASIAVLPFMNMSRDQEDEYFADGLAEELLNVLSKIGGLRVAARTSAFQFKGKHDDIAVIGRKLNVDTVLEGSVRKAGNRLRVSVQLVKVADGLHLWSETYD